MLLKVRQQALCRGYRLGIFSGPTEFGDPSVERGHLILLR